MVYPDLRDSQQSLNDDPNIQLLNKNTELSEDDYYHGNESFPNTKLQSPPKPKTHLMEDTKLDEELPDEILKKY